jgi:hypothetical protein
MGPWFDSTGFASARARARPISGETDARAGAIRATAWWPQYVLGIINDAPGNDSRGGERISSKRVRAPR